MGAPEPDEQRVERREAEERSRAEAAESRERAREAREAQERQADREREHQRDLLAASNKPVPTYTAGGGPSFFLGVNEGLTGEVNNSGPSSPWNPHVITENVNVMGNRAVAPGSRWEIFGIYLASLFEVVLQEGTEVIENPEAIFKMIGTLVRNGTTPIWIGSTEAPGGFAIGAFTSKTSARLVLGTEFASPIVIGPGETISLNLILEAKVVWGKAKKLGLLNAFSAVNGVGSIRYNIHGEELLNGSNR